VEQYQLNEIRAARVFALVNMAMMDAGIAAWDTKLQYWQIRPWQADPTIDLAVDPPNSPSYVSTHASWSGAGAEVLSYLFPEEKESLQAKAEEASTSRIYEGIHYRFDIEAGLIQGRAVAKLAIEHSQLDGAPLPCDTTGPGSSAESCNDKVQS
jgi:membrane-associated phospholipid phosphatase